MRRKYISSYRNEKMETNFPLDLMGEDFYGTVEFTLRSFATPGSYYDPPEGPEYEIDKIYIQRDTPGNLGPKFEVTESLFETLAYLPRVEENIEETIADYEYELRNGYFEEDYGYAER